VRQPQFGSVCSPLADVSRPVTPNPRLGAFLGLRVTGFARRLVASEVNLLPVPLWCLIESAAHPVRWSKSPRTHAM